MLRRATGSFAALALAVACAVLATGPAGAQDSADSLISVEKVEEVRISKIDDILIGVFGADGTITQRQYRTDQFDYQCVYSTTGGYRLTVSSANSAGRLELVSDAGDAMRYELHLWFRRQGGSFQYTSTRYRNAPIDLPGLSASRSPTCADEGLDNSNLIVTGLVLPEDFNPAPPGVYRDVLTLTVSPE